MTQIIKNTAKILFRAKPSLYIVLISILLVSNMITTKKGKAYWKNVDKELDSIDHLSDKTLIKEYNHSRTKELTDPLLKL